MQARKRALTRTQIGQHLDLAIPVSRAVRKYSSVLSNLVYGFLLWQPELTGTAPQVILVQGHL